MSTTRLDTTERRTVEAFNLEAELQLKIDSPGTVGEDLLYAFSLLPDNPLILDIGCGYGRMIDALREMDPCQYFGIDPSIEMLNIGKMMYPETNFHNISLYDLPHEFPSDHFDMAMVITTFTYVTPSRMEEALASIRKVLKPSGLGYFVILEGDHSICIAQNRIVRQNYPGPVATLHGWTFKKIKPALTKSGFSIIALNVGMCRYSLIVQRH